MAGRCLCGSRDACVPLLMPLLYLYLLRLQHLLQQASSIQSYACLTLLHACCFYCCIDDASSFFVYCFVRGRSTDCTQGVAVGSQAVPCDHANATTYTSAAAMLSLLYRGCIADLLALFWGIPGLLAHFAPGVLASLYVRAATAAAMPVTEIRRHCSDESCELLFSSLLWLGLVVDLWKVLFHCL